MKPEELRIGNWVKYKGVDVKWDISDFSEDTAIRLSEPIPLTEEWLIKFGFNNWDENKWELSNIILLQYDDGFTYLANSLHVDFFYVHQLQNLFYALTGKELTTS